MPGSETIAAAATPPGISALAIVRASGPLARDVALGLVGEAPLPPERRPSLRTVHAADGAPIDQVLLTWYAGPGSVTGEDVLELTCHGNPLISNLILERMFALGCRPAHPGEFTRRAFTNGRVDLSQAEAVLEVIGARSTAALTAAQRLLAGDLGRRIAGFSEALQVALAQVEAYLDFPEEDLPAEDLEEVRRPVLEVLQGATALAGSVRAGRLVRDGVKIVLTGRTNVGKSSLLNRLAGFDRAIVDPAPGTTRDYLEVDLEIAGVRASLVDTAGVRPEADGIEAAGIARSLEHVAAADLLLVVAEHGDGPLPSPAEWGGADRDASGTILVCSKSDLSPTLPAPSCPGWASAVEVVSSTTGVGIEGLRARLESWIRQAAGGAPGATAGVSARHAEALAATVAYLEAALLKLGQGTTDALLASDLRGALSSLGQITGSEFGEAVLDRIFSKFCIGK